MTEEKLDYRKRDKELYQPGTKPAVVRVPAMKFIMVDAAGRIVVAGRRNVRRLGLYAEGKVFLDLHDPPAGIRNAGDI
jgi:hypothetical protein